MAANGQLREVKNLSGQVRYWKNRAAELNGQLTKSEEKKEFYGSQLSEFKSRMGKAESMVLATAKDYDDLKKTCGEYQAQIRQLQQKCESYERVNQGLNEGLNTSKGMISEALDCLDKSRQNTSLAKEIAQTLEDEYNELKSKCFWLIGAVAIEAICIIGLLVMR